MPELSRFFGIVIRMFIEAGGSHHLPHFHAYYQEHVGVYGLDPIERIAVFRPNRQERLVLAWAELHRDELISSWNTLQAVARPLRLNH